MTGPQNRSRILFSQHTGSDFSPDGNLNKEIWLAAPRIRFDQSAFDESCHPNSETAVASCWTADFLYLAFWCRYQTLNLYPEENPDLERWELWERDVVEAFIAPQPQYGSHYYEFEVAPNNQWLDVEIDLNRTPYYALWNSGFEHATQINSENHLWTAEMRIPVASMRVEPLCAQHEWRINFYRCDGPGKGDARRMLCWSPLPRRAPGGSFHQPDSFGELRFTAS